MGHGHLWDIMGPCLEKSGDEDLENPTRVTPEKISGMPCEPCNLHGQMTRRRMTMMTMREDACRICKFPKMVIPRVVPPKSSILIGFSFIYIPSSYWGTPILGNRL